MNKIKNNIMVLLLVVCATCYSQKDKLGGRIILSTENMSKTTFYVYEPIFKAKQIYTNITQAKNYYPEQLMSSVLSANTQEWIDYNTLGGKQKSDIKKVSYFKKVNKYDKEKTYFELQAKLNFTVNNNEMAIIKFYFYQQNKKKPVAGALVMQKQDNVWKITSKPYTTTMAMALMVFKPQIFKRLLTNRPKNNMEKKLLQRVYKNSFSFKLLLEQKMSLEEKEYFTNPLNW